MFTQKATTGACRPLQVTFERLGLTQSLITAPVHVGGASGLIWPRLSLPLLRGTRLLWAWRRVSVISQFDGPAIKLGDGR
jgi:hypothetical protein